MSCRSIRCRVMPRCCHFSCNDLIALALILAFGIIFFGDFDQGVFATVIAIVSILGLS